MNVIGAIILCVTGIAIIIGVRKVVLNHKTIDYSKYPSTTGTVGHKHNFKGDRWIVSFHDQNGNEVLGMDDIFYSGTFFANKYNLPKHGTQEKIYFWKYDNKFKYSINNKKIEYYIHFCNESFYDLKKKRNKMYSIINIAMGIFFIICGILIFFKG